MSYLSLTFHIKLYMRWKFIDQITETHEVEHIKGEIRFPQNDEWHQDHFPKSPIIPGVLQIEVVANLTGKLIEGILNFV